MVDAVVAEKMVNLVELINKDNAGELMAGIVEKAESMGFDLTTGKTPFEAYVENAIPGGIALPFHGRDGELVQQIIGYFIREYGVDDSFTLTHDMVSRSLEHDMKEEYGQFSIVITESEDAQTKTFHFLSVPAGL